MNQERLLKVLVAPVISEKSTMVAEKLNQACFVVVPDANKAEVKKMYRAAMASIWSKLVADERLCVVESFAVESPKTKAFATQLKTMGLQNKVLLVVGAEELTDNLILASRNMKDVLVVPTRYADPLCLLYFDKVVVTKAAVSEIEEMLA